MFAGRTLSQQGALRVHTTRNPLHHALSCGGTLSRVPYFPAIIVHYTVSAMIGRLFLLDFGRIERFISFVPVQIKNKKIERCARTLGIK